MLQPPRELRDTFNLLSLLDQDVELDHLLDRVDWNGVTPQQACHAALGRLPQDLHYSGLSRTLFEPQAYFRMLLLCPEFQAQLVPNLLAAFPEKPRRFFVHIPRCGGTSLGQTLALHACTVPHTAIGSAWCSGRAFLAAVAAITRNLPGHEAIHVSGHYTLRSLVDGRLARFGDTVWTSVRAPQDIVLSYVNYILTTLATDRELTRPDTRRWARQLKLDAPLDALPPAALRALLPRMIRDDTLLSRDLLCHFLGDGTAASALDLLAAADVEVIDSMRLDQWREQRWNAPATPWANISKSFFRWSTLDDAERSLVTGLIGQDTVLHRAIASSFGAAGAVSGLRIAALSPSPPNAAPASPVRRASRAILLDPGFVRLPAVGAPVGRDDGQVGWADPPLNYRTIETTLRFPLIETRIRVRYARRRLAWPGSAWWQQAAPWPRLIRRLGAVLAR